MATELDPEWYQAWHTWALANFDAITQLETALDGLPSSAFTSYIIPAAEGFLRSIALSPGNSLQDTLRLLTLWFTYGYDSGVNTAITMGLHTVNVDVWLEVIPQVSIELLELSVPDENRLSLEYILLDQQSSN
jgi:FKBP12-rapamycin complex-associated protein